MSHFNLALLFVCFFYSGSTAQTGWQALNGPQRSDGAVLLGIDQTNRVYIKGSQGLYTSSDNAFSWVKSDDGLNAVQIASINALTLFPSGKVSALIAGSYFTYNPTGNSWAEDLPLSGLGSVWFDHAGNFWKRIGNDLYHSTDNGQSFTPVLPGIYGNGSGVKVANYDDSNNLYSVNFSDFSYIYVFTGNGTVTHSKMQANPIFFIGYNKYSGTAFYSDGSKNYRSADGGITWDPVTIGAYGYIYRMMCVSASELWAVTNTGLFHSLDDGQTWTKIPLTDSNAQLFSTSNGTAIIKDDCTPLSFSKSDDGGQTWTSIQADLASPDVTAVYTSSNDVVYAKSCHSFSRSDDGGQSWSTATVTDGTSSNMDNLAVLPDGTLFSLSKPTQHLMTSEDGGITWVIIPTPVGLAWWDDDLSVLKTDKFGNLFLLVEQSSSYTSSDKGATWSPVGFSYVPTLNPDDPIWVLGNGDYFQPWLNGFIHYVSSTNTKGPETMTFLNSNTVIHSVRYATASNQDDFYMDGTTDTGKPFIGRYAGNKKVEPFTSFPGSNPGPMAVSTDGILFAASNDSLFASANKGADWIFEGSLPYPYTGTQTLECLQICADEHLYLGYYGHVVYKSDKPIINNYSVIQGVAWLDQNNNCIREPDEPLLGNAYVRAHGQLDAGGFANASGNYWLYLPSGTGTYSVAIQPPNPLFESSCSVSVTTGSQQDTLTADIAVHSVTPCPYLQVNASTSLLRRCNTSIYTVAYHNTGTDVATDAHLEVTLDSFFVFQSASAPPSAQNGQVLTFALGDLPPGASGSIQIQFEISCQAPVHQIHCLKAQIFPVSPCLAGLPDLSESTECRQNVSSFDPNEKHAFVDGKEDPASVAPNGTIEYLINFQNIGTDTAFTVVVKDRIAEWLDLSSFVPLASSNPYDFTVLPDRTLIMTFSGINLPDSTTNEPASHGFVKFGIRQIPDLAPGKAINNTAQIYFDSNEPVPTNTSHLVVTIPVKVNEPLPGYSVQVFPNPFEDGITFMVNAPEENNVYHLTLTDALGRSISNRIFTGPSCKLERAGMESGIYFFSIEAGNGQQIATGRLVAR
jgi:uncharacterized repeat protein (TIGR01451 family)